MKSSYRSISRKLIILCLCIFSAQLAATKNGSGNDNGLKYIGHIQTRNSSQVNNSPWGIQIGSLEKEHVEKAAEIGIKWTRLGLSWEQVEKQKEKYSWESADTAFATAIKNGIIPFICLAGSNKIYCREENVDPRQKEIYGSNSLPPVASGSAAMSAWLKFVRLAVERYKSSIKYWEIWNEPNHPHYWGTEPNGESYGKLLYESAVVIKAADPDAKIIGGALAGLDPAFTEAFLKNGTASKIDIITFHNYAELPEERIYKALETWDIINKYNPEIQLWQGECGYPSHSNTRDYRGTSPWGINIQAKWLLRQAFTDVFFCKTTLSNYFKLVHQGGRGQLPKRSFLTSIDSVLGYPSKGGSRVKSVGVNEKCILENPSLKPKPAYSAYKNLCAIYDSRYKASKVNSKIQITENGSFYGIGSEDDAFPSIPLLASFSAVDSCMLLAYWLPWHPQEYIKEARVTISFQDVKFNEPVLIDPLNGRVYKLEVQFTNEGSCYFSNLPLADYPYVIAEKSEIILDQNLGNK